MPLPSFVPRQPYQRTRSSGSLSKGANYFESASGPIANFNNVINYGIAVGTQKNNDGCGDPGFQAIASPREGPDVAHVADGDHP